MHLWIHQNHFSHALLSTTLHNNSWVNSMQKKWLTKDSYLTRLIWPRRSVCMWHLSTLIFYYLSEQIQSIFSVLHLFCCRSPEETIGQQGAESYHRNLAGAPNADVSPPSEGNKFNNGETIVLDFDPNCFKRSSWFQYENHQVQWHHHYNSYW